MPAPIAALWEALRADQRAVTALEYGLVASMVAVIITMAVDMLGHRVMHVFNGIASSL